MYSCKGKTQTQLHQIFNDPNHPITLCWDNGSGGEHVNSTCEVAHHYCPNLRDKEAEQSSPGSHRKLTSKLGQKQGLHPVILTDPVPKHRLNCSLLLYHHIHAALQAWSCWCTQAEVPFLLHQLYQMCSVRLYPWSKDHLPSKDLMADSLVDISHMMPRGPWG